MTFKKSTAKSVPELDFVPVNLHIQQMKVKVDGTEERGEQCEYHMKCHVTSHDVGMGVT